MNAMSGSQYALNQLRPSKSVHRLGRNTCFGEDSDEGVKCAKRVKCRKGEVPRGLKSPTLHVLVAVSQC
jgi:hypothetical protein